MYEEFLPSVEYYLWKFELPPSMRVNWGKCEIKEEDGTVKGKATAKVFIILLHEVAKIAVELLFLQSVVDIQDQYGEHVKKYVIMNADKYEDEQWMKLIGPRMWKHLHDCMDYIVKAKGNDYTVVAYLLNSIGVLYPENFFLVTDMILNDGEKAIVLLEEMYDQIMEEIEVFRQQEEEAPKKKVRKGRGKKARNISDYTVDELNKILEDAVESEEFEKAAYIKAELDKR
jgi:PHD/YefM family antitoxin component YafN of YafNO toxin-antitoxin module